jgi:hypothetical protein
VETEASAEVVWSLPAEPARRHECSLCVAGAEGLGDPEVEADAVSGPLWAPPARGYRLPTALIARNVARVAATPR